jgi:hypothetical protein
LLDCVGQEAESLSLRRDLHPHLSAGSDRIAALLHMRTDAEIASLARIQETARRPSRSGDMVRSMVRRACPPVPARPRRQGALAHHQRRDRQPFPALEPPPGKSSLWSPAAVRRGHATRPRSS